MERIRMKSRLAVLIFVCSLVLSAVPVCAAGSSSKGLMEFNNAKTYDDPFTDVSPDAWYYDGIRTVYEKGIMDGIGESAFGPSQTVTWAQAVTIAARLHARYNGNEIPEEEGSWFLRYFSYAGSAGLLPAEVPSMDAVNAALISRQALAALFRSVLSEDDLPAVNDLVPPDLEEVDAQYRQAVLDMYASGIFTGKDENRFDPDGLSTRAEIATIIMRLLCPALRVSSDSRVNQASAAQYGNFLMGGFAASGQGVTYYLTCEREREKDDLSTSCTIVARTDRGELRDIYTAAPEYKIYQLMLGDDGKIYFLEKKYRPSGFGLIASLKTIDPNTGEVETLYSSKSDIASYTLYDGKVILCEDVGTIEFSYCIKVLENGKTTILMDGISFVQSLYFDRTFYCFGGKLYFIYGESGSGTRTKDSLWSLDLTSKALEKVIDSELMNLHLVAFNGATVWFSSGSNEQWTLCRANLLMPELIETFCEIPQEAQKQYPKLYANGTSLYYQSSYGLHLWQVSSCGEFRELLTLESPYTECSAVTGQGILAYSQRDITMQYNESIDVFLPEGGKTNYLSFLGKPSLVGGVNALDAAKGEKTWDNPEKISGEINSGMVREYRTVRGDYAAEITLVNGNRKNVRLTFLEVSFSIGGESFNRSFSVTGEFGAGESRTFTVIVPAEMLVNADQEASPIVSWTIMTGS